jgi:lipopolysaccharide assembly outer membrane protein LptD (OstA)
VDNLSLAGRGVSVLFRVLMRKTLLCLALAGEVVFGGLLLAQDTQSPWKVEVLNAAGVIKYDLTTGEMRATNGVRVQYKAGTPEAADLTSDSVTLNQKSGNIVATGNVILRREGTVWKAERLDYNFRTKKVATAQFRTRRLAYFMKGAEITGSQTNGVYQASEIIFATDDLEKPSMFIKAKSVEVIPGEHVIFRDATLHIGNQPVFYLPYYKRSLKRHPWNIHFEPGYKSEWGPYLLSSIRWPSDEQFGGEFHLDYRSKRGFGLGPTINYHSEKWGIGDLNLYRAFDDDPLTDSRGLAIDRERDLAQWSHRLRRGNFTATAVLGYESDEFMRRDFYEELYRNNVQPNTYLELSQNWENYNLSVLVQPRVNAFYENIDRVPDLKLSGTRHRIGDSPFFYDTETSIGYLRRRYDNASANNDYGLLRADTLHQIYLPKTYGGWLNVTPRIGGRFTHYGETDGTGSSKTRSERYVFNTGVEVSAKFSKLMPNATSKLFDVNGIRHIIQPSINYAFIPRPNRVPNELDQFDYELTSPRLLPIEFPEYNAIDNIDSQNVLRLSLRNRLQTRRDGALQDVVDWDLYSDWRIDPNSGQNNFADLFSDAVIRPRSWLSLNSGLRYDLDNSLWRTINHGFTISPKPNRWSIQGGQYYYLPHPSTSRSDRTDVFYSGLGYRLNENWSFSTRQYYDSKLGEMSQHDYIVHRDMQSWTFFIDLSFRKATGRRDDEMRISFNYSLKFRPSNPDF